MPARASKDDVVGVATVCRPLMPAVPVEVTEAQHNLLSRATSIRASEEEKASRMSATDLWADSDHQPALFRSTTMRGVSQGELGDCWLVAAMSSFARFPRAVQALFRRRFLSENGEYEIKLYNIAEHTWVSVTVDDKVSTKTVGPQKAKHMQVNSMYEIWPLLLEKAVAKLYNWRVDEPVPDGKSGTSRINGGFVPLAFVAFNGGEGVKIFTNSRHAYQNRTKGAREWIVQELDSTKIETGIKDGNPVAYAARSAHRTDPERLWLEITEAMKFNKLMGCALYKAQPGEKGSGDNGEVLRTDGLYEGHAYSLINAVMIMPGTPLRVCKDSRTIVYKTREAYRAMYKRVNQTTTGSVFRGWGVGDIVYSHFVTADHVKSTGHLLRFEVESISNDASCEGEVCVNFVKQPSAEMKAKGVQPWGPSKGCPISWVTGRRGGGYTEDHGVREGWVIIATSQVKEPVGAISVTFQGIVDTVVCDEAAYGRGDELPTADQAYFADMPITTITRPTRLVRVRNPWGNSKMYNGDWSDTDVARWRQHPDVAAALNHQPGADGTWWMDYEQFVMTFQDVSISPVNMGTFDAPPTNCNTDWGATKYLPNSPRPILLDWTSKGSPPSRDQCAWCSERPRGGSASQAIQFWQDDSCANAFGSGHLGYSTNKNLPGGKKLCCHVAATREGVRELSWA